MSASQNIAKENVLDLPDTECSVGVEVCSSPILEHISSSLDITNISGISRVACTSPITGKKNNLLLFTLKKYVYYIY